jgi:hypothetical protein
MGRVQMVAMRQIRVVPCLFVITSFVMFRRLPMMVRRLLVMLCSLAMMLCAFM